MLKLRTENKRLSVNYAGEHKDREQLLELKERLLDKLESESDPDKREGLKNQIAEIKTGIDALGQARKTVDGVDLELKLRQLKRRAEELRIAGEAAESFRSNCDMLATIGLERYNRDKCPMFDGDGSLPWRRRHLAYFTKLFNELSYDEAQTQRDEFDRAQIERREWVELVKMPRPDPLKPAYIREVA